jgi:hypothetical protein
MQVEEIRKLLVEKGLTEEEANDIKGKSALMGKLAELVGPMDEVDEVDDSDEILESAEVIEDPSPHGNIPLRTSREWNDYVLSQLFEDEKKDGHPTVDGLRRLVELLIGEINSESDVNQCPGPDNQYSATVTVHISAGFRKMSGAADVNPKNTEGVYAKHAVATAESKAEGRAFRKLLGLRGVLAAEELVDESQIEDTTDKIKDAQISMLNITAKKQDVDIEKWLAKKNISVSKLDSVSNSKGIELCEELNAMRNTGVPDDIKGYNPNWR